MRGDTFYFMRKIPVDLLRYLPKFLAKDPTFKALEDTLSWEHENLRLKLVDIAKQFFLETSTWGLSDWERFLGITPEEGQSFELRKAVARQKLRGADTMTVENTLKLMRNFMDSGEPGLEELGDNEIRLILENGVYHWKELFQALFDYLPAQLEFSIKFYNHYDNELFIGIPEVRAGKTVIDGAAIGTQSNEISIANENVDASQNVINYDTSDYAKIDSQLVITNWLQVGGYEKINADIPKEDADEWAWEEWLWLRWLQWSKNAVVRHYNHHFDDEGEIPDDPEWEEPFPLDRSFLRLYWEFPDNTIRYMTLKNPRDDLTGADINAVGNYAAANKAIINSRGYIPYRIKRALIKTESRVNLLGGHAPKSTDNGKFPPNFRPKGFKK